MNSLDWHDLIRVLVVVMNVFALFLLLKRYKANHNEWTTKTIDLWYSLSMWTLGGAIFAIQGVVLDRPLTPAFVFLVAATLVGAKALHAKGAWGGHDS